MKTIPSANLKQTASRQAGWTRLATLIAVMVPCALVGLIAGKMLGGKGATKSVPASIPQPVRPANRTAKAPPPPAPPAVQPAAVRLETAVTPRSVEPREEKTPPQKAPRPVEASSAPSTRIREETVRYGKSEQGRPLTAYVLGDGPDVTMIFGAFHGNEPATPGVVSKLRDYLKANPKYLQGRRVVLAPVVNPDGLRRGDRSNANGVDINRNFPGTWRKQATKARYNPGPSPASESETKAVINLMNTYQPSKVVSIHQPFHTMNYTGEAGRQLALAMQKENHYPITPDIGYPTPGSFGDYCGKTRGIAIVTHELPVQSAGAAWRANREALLAAITH